VLQEFKSLQIERASMDQMLALVVFGKGLRAEFEARTLPTPEWLTDGLKTLNREIDRQRQDELERRKKQLTAEDAADRTSAERREARKKEMEAIEAALVGSK
jgi:hypothetical protein